MTEDFIIRRTGAQTLTSCMTRDEMRPLMADYALAKRAGAIVATQLRPFRMNINFQDPSRCRIDGRRLVLLVDNAAQQNRIRQLTPRLCAAVATGGLPITSVDIRILPKHIEPPFGVPLPCSPRLPSAVGAAAIDRILDDFEDPALKAVMTRLRDALKPKSDARRQSLEEQFGKESLELAFERARQVTLIDDLTHGLHAQLIPSEKEAEGYPRLEAERARKLLRRSEMLDQKRTAEHAVLRIDRRLEAINRALTLLPMNVQAAEAALIDESDSEIAPEPSAPRRTSAAAAAAIAALARETPSPRTRKALLSHLPELKPEGKDYLSHLSEGIEREKNRLLDSESLTPQQQKRLALLLKAERALSSGTVPAEEVADRLYGLE